MVKSLQGIGKNILWIHHK